MSFPFISLFDIDKTIYDTPIFLVLSKFQLENNLIKVSCTETLSKDIKNYKDGVIDYETAVSRITQHWAEGLEGVDEELVLNNAKIFFSQNKNHFYPFLDELFNLLKLTYDIYLVTGEPQFVAEAIVKMFGLTGYFSSILSTKNNIYTGKIDTILAYSHDKEHAIQSILNKYSMEKSLGFGDSEGDIGMLSKVQIPICIMPSVKLKMTAEKNQWMVINDFSEVISTTKMLIR